MEQTPIDTQVAQVQDAHVATATEVTAEQYSEPLLDNSTAEEILAALRQYAQVAPINNVNHFANKARRKFDELIKRKRDAHKQDFEQKVAAQGEDVAEEDRLKLSDYVALEESVVEKEFKTLLNTISDEYSLYLKKIEAEQKQNLLVKQNIIANFRAIVDANEAVKRIKECKDYQEQWKKTGRVPQENNAEINQEYKQLLNDFFEQVKLSRELRELDNKKNIEAKEGLIKAIEALLDEESVSRAFHASEDLFKQWKEVGYTGSKEKGDELWERFNNVRKQIVTKFRSHVGEIREGEENNYKIKQQLCDELQAILDGEFTSASLCDHALNKLKDIQERWRKAGFAPKNVSEQIYAKYRDLCDAIFDKRRAFFKEQDASLQSNLTIKEQLCERAEALKNSEDWKAVADELKALQAKWKQVGPVPRKVSDEIWKRFRGACDYFFERKDKAMDSIDAEYAVNLEKKQALIDELSAYTMPTDEKSHVAVLKDFQKRWNSIGFVPQKHKDAVNGKWTKLMDAQYDKLHLDSRAREAKQYELKVDQLHGENDILRERDRVRRELQKAELELAQVQNNAGFFANFKGDAKMMRDIEKNIEKAQKQVEKLKSCIALLNEKLKG